MFEFDPSKSVANKLKHGIDLGDAQALWLDPRRVEVESSQQHHGEHRTVLIAQAYGRMQTAIVTRRDDPDHLRTPRQRR